MIVAKEQIIIVVPRCCIALSGKWGLSVFDGDFSLNEGDEAISVGNSLIFEQWWGFREREILCYVTISPGYYRTEWLMSDLLTMKYDDDRRGRNFIKEPQVSSRRYEGFDEPRFYVAQIYATKRKITNSRYIVRQRVPA